VFRQRRQIFLNQPPRHRVHRDESDLVALPLDAEVHHALAALYIADAKREQKLFAPDAVIEQGGQYRAVPYALQRIGGRGLQQPPRLRIAEGRRAACVAVGHRALDAVHRIAGDGVVLAQVIEQ